MKYVVHPNIHRNEVFNRAPPELRGPLAVALDAVPKHYSSITLIVFGNDANDVVLSSHVRKALKKSKSVSSAIAVAGAFTIEADLLLRSSGYVPVQVRHAVVWTDANYKRIRQRWPSPVDMDERTKELVDQWDAINHMYSEASRGQQPRAEQ